MKEKQIVVIGYNSDHCTDNAYRLAYEVGGEVALQGAVLITGGLGGVMEAASKGAKDRGGLVVGIIPQDEKHYANVYCDVVIPTGLGHSGFDSFIKGKGVNSNEILMAQQDEVTGLASWWGTRVKISKI